MSEVDKLVNQMAEELNSPNEYSLSTSPESNPSYILINSDRTLTVPDNLKKIGIQYDHKVESVVFKCPRYHDGVDLSTMSTIYINWMKSNNKGGKSICTLDTVNPDDTYLTFTWEITQDVTSERGLLSIMVCMSKTNEFGTETLLHWNSEINKELYVGDGLHVSDEEILNSYEPGLVEQIMKRIDEAEKTVRSYSIDIKEIPAGYSITMTDNEGTETFNILHGYASDKGATFTPSVAEDGTLSWINDKELDNPPSVNIKGPKGDRGETVYVPSVSEEGVLSWTNDGGLENPAEVNIRGPQGDRGDAGEQGPKGDTGEHGPMGATYEDKELIDGAADLDPLQKYRIHIPMNKKSITETGMNLIIHDSGDKDTRYIRHAITINNDIYYIQQGQRYDDWPILFVYRTETNTVEKLITLSGCVFHPIDSHMMVHDNKYIVIWGYYSARLDSDYNTVMFEDAIWHGAGSVTIDITASTISYLVEDNNSTVETHISTPGMVTVNKSLSNIDTTGMYPMPEQDFTYIFGGYDAATKNYNTKVYAMWTGLVSGQIYNFMVEVKDANGKSIALEEDSYITTTAVVNNKVYLYSVVTQKLQVFNLETHLLESPIPLPIVNLANYGISIDEDTKIPSITSTVVIDNKIYYLLADYTSSGDKGKIVRFDPADNKCQPIDPEDVYGVAIPNGKLPEDSEWEINSGQLGALPTIYLNNTPYIISCRSHVNTTYSKPVYFEDPGDMQEDYLWLTSEEFTSDIDFLDGIDFYDDIRNYFEFEICGLKPNDICTKVEIDYTYNNERYTKTIDLPWVNGATKDISTIKLHVEHANKVLRYNTNTEYGELTGIASIEANYQKKTDENLNTEDKTIVGAINEVNENKFTNYQVIERPAALPTATETSPDFIQIGSKLYRKVTTYDVLPITSLADTSWHISSGWSCISNYGYFTITGSINDFKFSVVGIGRYKSSTNQVKANSIVFYPVDDTSTAINFSSTDEIDVAFTDGEDVENEQLISWLKSHATITYAKYGTIYSYEEVGIVDSGGGSSLDVQINGTSIVENGVANIPVATASKPGVIRAQSTFGNFVSGDNIYNALATNTEIDAKTSKYKPVVPANLDYAVKVGVTTNTNELTDEEKASAQAWLGISGGGGTQLYKHELIFGRVDTPSESLQQDYEYETRYYSLKFISTHSEPFENPYSALEHLYDNALLYSASINYIREYRYINEDNIKCGLMNYFNFNSVESEFVCSKINVETGTYTGLVYIQYEVGLIDAGEDYSPIAL